MYIIYDDISKPDNWNLFLVNWIYNHFPPAYSCSFSWDGYMKFSEINFKYFLACNYDYYWIKVQTHQI